MPLFLVSWLIYQRVKYKNHQGRILSIDSRQALLLAPLKVPQQPIKPNLCLYSLYYQNSQ
ncbi:hypothetical protein N0398_09260 [Providencia rettgeri]|nr:hypothetical protein [Providencia rettgeri]